ncbi:MAG: 1-deoxy-D-xylulose-5-phosphate reductoisomerase [Desulfobacteraceae bacterium]|jgi:1-deoxy-D-xylulose-5-phosphate reductoisomerase|nr:1-deoxy-D-xylulose-5-phosphate reductoisomerase [Desulfobacteraceae bacterium]
MKNIAILGSTGSIGTQTLDIVARFPDRFNIIALVAHRNVDLLKNQIKKFQPELVVVSDEKNAEILSKGVDIRVLAGEENIVTAATDHRVDMVINSLVGKSGLLPTIEAIKLGKEIGLANKETLVLAGNIVMQLAKKHNVSIIPIDSEHCALFQSLRSGAHHDIQRLILTMGKGPIAGMDKRRLSTVSMQDVLDRPYWDMGMKINVDSATCVNKAFEVIEARWLFDVPANKISIVVHPQYLCHSLVEFKDGSIICELGTADMKRYTQYALFYPDRGISPKGSFIDLFEKPLAFEAPPFDKFPCLGMGHYVIEKGGTMPAVFHGADTTAVKAFMDKKIKFMDIPVIIQNTMDAHELIKDPDLDKILESEKWAEEYAKSLVLEYD